MKRVAASSRTPRPATPPDAALQPGAAEPLLRLTWVDRETGRRAYVVIDRLVNGVAGGGTRMRAGATMEETERLARVMTLKNGAFKIPAGGAKAALDCDPRDADARQVLARFLRSMRFLLETHWATGEDMGTRQADLNDIADEIGIGASTCAGLKRGGDLAMGIARFRAAVSEVVDGAGMPEVIGGYGVAEAMHAAMTFLGARVDGARAVVQGFGSMGASAARYLTRYGMQVVGIADAAGTIARADGLDVEELLRARNSYGEIDRSRLGSDVKQLGRDDWLSLDADVLVPAAVGDCITAANCGEISARLVLEAANMPTTEEARRLLHERGVLVIPDFVANAGVNIWLWGLMLDSISSDPQAAFHWCSRAMRDAVQRVLASAESDGVTPREAAVFMAVANVEAAVERYGAG